MKIPTIYWYRDPKNETDQFNEGTIRGLLASFNKGRKNKLLVIHIFIESFVDVNPLVAKPTMVICCGAHPKTEIPSGVYLFRCLGDMENEVVRVLNEEFPDNLTGIRRIVPRRAHPSARDSS